MNIPEYKDLVETEVLLSSPILGITKTLLTNFPGYLFIKNTESQYVFCNNNLAKLFGFQQNYDLIMKKIEELGFHKQLADEINADDEYVIKTNNPIKKTYVLPSNLVMEQEIIIEVEKKPLLKNNKVIGILGTGINVTDSNLILKKPKINKIYEPYNLDCIIENMPGYIYWKNLNSQYMGCNNNLAKISGLKNRKEIIGKTDYDFDWGNGQANQFRADDLYIINNKAKLVTEHELPIRREDGHFLNVRTEKIPLYNESKEVTGILAIAIDITEQKILEQKLIEEMEKTKELNAAKSNFIRNMEHDIRTPFNGAYSIAKILEEKEENHEKKELLGIIRDCSKELLDYCNSIIDFSAIESGLQPIVTKKLDLKRLIDSILKMEKPPATKKGLKIYIDYPHDVPNIIVGDAYRLQRILLNLVSNAIKFTEKGYVKIAIKVVSQPNAKNIILRFFVEDTGIGIPEDKKNFIFETLTRLSPSNQAKYSGSGLGLSIVKHLVEELNGEIELKTCLGKGTIFVCTLPFILPLVNEILF